MKCVTFTKAINILYFPCLLFLSAQVNAVGISWTHNLNEPTESSENHYLPNIDGAAVTAALNIGYGDDRRLHLANLPGTDKLMGMGISDQTSTNGAGINRSFTIKDPVTSGIRSWHELR